MDAWYVSRVSSCLLSIVGCVGCIGCAALPEAEADATPVAIIAPINRVEVNGVRGEVVPQAFLAKSADGHSSLIQLDWEIPGGTEKYLCGRITVPQDVYVNAFYPMSPPGTHHTALTVRDVPNAPDGVNECDVSEVGSSSLFGSAVGTMGSKLPDGVGVKFAAGSQLVFNLHLMNTTELPLRGRSGTLVDTTSEENVRVLGDGVAVGPLKLAVPPGISVQTGVCTVDHDYSIYGVLPHMHQTGKHMRVTAQRAGLEELQLFDGPFSFDNQVSHRFAPIALHKGDTMTVECTYENPQSRTLHFGESSNDEMCIAGIARFPAGGKAACPY